MGSALKHDTVRDDLAKRLYYRQAVLAASILTGTQRNLDICMEMEDEILGLTAE